MKISVALTSCNSAGFIEEQLDSVLCQLDTGDEVVISADPSSDGTQKILNRYAGLDSRVRLLEGKGEGLLANFENAIAGCLGDVIFLCDHDDVWLPGKVNQVKASFADARTMVVLHDAKVCDGQLQVTQDSFMEWRGSKEGFWPNVLRNSFIGCCMAFRSELRTAVLPFPKDLPMHDQWIGLMGYRRGAVVFLHEPLLLYRRHGGNMSSTEHAGGLQMVKWRLALLKNLSKNR